MNHSIVPPLVFIFLVFIFYLKFGREFRAIRLYLFVPYFLAYFSNPNPGKYLLQLSESTKRIPLLSRAQYKIHHCPFFIAILWCFTNNNTISLTLSQHIYLLSSLHLQPASLMFIISSLFKTAAFQLT